MIPVLLFLFIALSFLYRFFFFCPFLHIFKPKTQPNGDASSKSLFGFVITLNYPTKMQASKSLLQEAIQNYALFNLIQITKYNSMPFNSLNRIKSIITCYATENQSFFQDIKSPNHTLRM